MLLALALSAAIAAVALGAAGDLTYQGCFTQNASGCGAPANNGVSGLAGADGVATSPDNKSVYVASLGSDAIVRFDRDPATGALTFMGCFTQQSSCGAGHNGVIGLAGARSVAVSPDNKSVYVASENSDAIVRFDRDPGSGALTYEGCFTQQSGCGAPFSGVIGLSGAADVTVSPDNKSVYVASLISDALVRFDRLPATGALTYQGCFTAQSGCGSANDGVIGLDGALGVAVSPDNKGVYVASSNSNAITRFDRDPTGALTYRGCTSSDLSSGCAVINNQAALGFARGVAVSPDNKSVYVASLASNAITRFDRDPTNGALTFRDCITSASSGCAVNGAAGLGGAFGVAASADGEGVYVASLDSDAIVRLDRDPTNGALTYEGCFTSGPSGCAVNGVAGLAGARRVAVSADGRSVYVASFDGSAIVRLDRATPTLTVAKAGAGSVTSSPAGINCGASCSHAYDFGTSVTLTATHAAGSRFSGWSGGACSGTGACTLVLGSDRTVTASFAAVPSNAFKIGKPKLNRKKGTAKLPVKVTDAGKLSLAGKGVRKARKSLGAAGAAKLAIKPKGKLKRKLRRVGKAKVKVKVTFAPTGGTPASKAKKLKLIEKR
jgi:DNA-binding beta-propeller fold protein YncE